MVLPVANAKSKNPRSLKIGDLGDTDNSGRITKTSDKKEGKINTGNKNMRISRGKKSTRDVNRNQNDAYKFKTKNNKLKTKLVTSKSYSFKNLTLRVWWSLIMIVIGGLLISHGITFYLTLAGIIFCVYKELMDLKMVNIPTGWYKMHRFLQWYLFAVIVAYCSGKIVISTVLPRNNASRILLYFLIHKRIILFLLYCLGIIIFVLTLEKSYYKQQFITLVWINTGIFLVWCELYAVSSTLVNGPIWVILPILLVIINDTSAYFFGKLFGSTPLIKLSPKKTWEGFLGGFFSTVLLSFFISSQMSKYPYLYCPLNTLNVSALAPTICDKPPLFIPRNYQIPVQISEMVKLIMGNNISTVKISPFQIHTLIFAIFGSLVSPFAGFLASGLKRALKIKDFSNAIPGHGGVIDRVDCHLLTAIFVFVYTQSFVRLGAVSDVTKIANYAVKRLTKQQISELVYTLNEFLNMEYII